MTLTLLCQLFVYSDDKLHLQRTVQRVKCIMHCIAFVSSEYSANIRQCTLTIFSILDLSFFDNRKNWLTKNITLQNEKLSFEMSFV